jgi:hypothetical protein
MSATPVTEARPEPARQPASNVLRNRRLRAALAGAVALFGLVSTGVAVFAGLNATANNTTAQTAGSGTLKLTLGASTGSAGFGSAISNLAPGDVVNRYVSLTNGGTIDATGLTLAASDSTATKLSTDATNGLHVSVSQCSGAGAAWNAGSGACTVTSGSPTTTTLLNNVSVSALVASAQTLISGSVTAGTVLPLQVSVSLPNQSETTTNGVLPAGTIQNLTANLTWTFSEAQRTGTTTNS